MPLCMLFHSPQMLFLFGDDALITHADDDTLRFRHNGPGVGMALATRCGGIPPPVYRWRKYVWGWYDDGTSYFFQSRYSPTANRYIDNRQMPPPSTASPVTRGSGVISHGGIEQRFTTITQEHDTLIVFENDEIVLTMDDLINITL
jgi:hypothetical protein